jgi:selenide,water dikinase
MTDVSGFGLAGHLGEMLDASGAAADLHLASLPLYGEVLDLANRGLSSTLLPANLARLALISGKIDEPAKAILFDPQTSGGLLAGIPAEEAAGCVSELRSAGYAHAVIIGRAKDIVAGCAPLSVTGSLVDS